MGPFQLHIYSWNKSPKGNRPDVIHLCARCRVVPNDRRVTKIGINFVSIATEASEPFH
ncbi:hypothetical protein RHMOL_Rhmol01G0091200 [Rhododendron molle]|uniref:Uncharacterized protein n=1 Tax=Rhododendron molle TaxID=49168 RepID=A0ACC0PZA5_RHOML|nr:hypothetical protein RHMOL_Rhmol01G0091200 [Rhododendron molle]